MEAISGRILIVEDEVNIRRGLRDLLTRDGHAVADAGSGEAALATLAQADHDLAIVDIRLPGMSGIELLQAIRRRWPHLAVVILTGHGDLASAMAAIKAGAHDYLLKPAQPDAIRQTVSEAVAVSRRRRERAHLLESLRSGLDRLDAVAGPPAVTTAAAGGARRLGIGDLQIDLSTHEVRRGEEDIHLSPSEFRLLVALASRPGDVIDYTTLVKVSLGYETAAWEARELIKRHVFALRQKLEPDPAAPRYLLNVRGVGYRLCQPE